MVGAQYCTVEITGSSDSEEFPAKVLYGWKGQPDLEQLPEDARIFMDLGERARVWDIKNALFTSAKKYKDAMQILEEKPKKTIRFRNGSGGYWYCDGVNNSYTVGVIMTSEARQIDYLGERFMIPSFKAVEA